MRSWLLLPIVLAVPAAVPAQRSGEAIVEVRLSNFEFDPELIRMRAGRSVTLRLVNLSDGGHNFAAPEFFSSAAIASGQNVPIREGAIEVPGEQTVSIRLTPVRGTFRLRCTHTMHSTFGMRGEIVVE